MSMNRSRIQIVVGLTLVAVSWSAWGGGIFNFNGSGSVSNSATAIPNSANSSRPVQVYSSGRDTVVVPSRNPTGSQYQPYTVLTPTGRYLMVPGADGSITTIIEVSRTRE